MKLIRSIIRGLLAWTVFMFVLGAIFALSPHAGEDIVGLLFVCFLCGGLVSLLRRPASNHAAQNDAPSAPHPSSSLAAPVGDQIPGSRGARMALGPPTAADTPPDAIAVSYRGETKAYVTTDTWQPVGAFAELTSADPEYRLVALMSVYAQQVLLGYESEYTEQDGIAYALGELVPHEILEHDIPDPSRTAAALRLPVDALTPQNLHALRAIINHRNEAEASTRDW